jgi:hypothetical protein
VFASSIEIVKRSRSRVLALFAVSILVGSVVACSRRRADVETICAAPSSSALPSLSSKMHTREGRETIDRLLASSTIDPAAVLSEEAKRAGVDPCPLASAMAMEEEDARYRRDVVLLCGYALDEVDRGALSSDRGRRLRDTLSTTPPDARAIMLKNAADALGLAGCASAR